MEELKKIVGEQGKNFEVHRVHGEGSNQSYEKV